MNNRTLDKLKRQTAKAEEKIISMAKELSQQHYIDKRQKVRYLVEKNNFCNININNDL